MSIDGKFYSQDAKKISDLKQKPTKKLKRYLSPIGNIKLPLLKKQYMIPVKSEIQGSGSCGSIRQEVLKNNDIKKNTFISQNLYLSQITSPT